jgi:hypothetical protein
MNESDNNFDQLKRLLQLKQHEVPPPGYFNHFSDQVVARLHTDEGRHEGLSDRLNIEAPWLISLLRVFEARPGVIGAFATSLCLLLVLGIIFTERSDSTVPQSLLAGDSALTPTTGNSLASLTSPGLAAPTEASGIVASTNPVASLQPAGAMFGQQNPLFQTASFATGH